MNKFWLSSGEWPSDPPGWLFLGRACKILGNAKFDGWGSSGFFTCEVLTSSISSMLSAAIAIPRSLHTNSAGRKATPVDQAKLSELQVSLADNLSKKGAVIQEMRAWAEGPPFLRTGTRPRAGGAVVPVDPVFWSNQRIENWFTVCQMNPREPYSVAFAGEGFQHIFVDREQFMALVRVKVEGSSSNADMIASGLREATPDDPAPSVEPKNKGGRSVEVKNWHNLVAVVGAVLGNNDIVCEDKPSRAELREKLESYADSIGLPIATKGTIDPAIDLLIRIAWAKHGGGEPLFAADGSSLRD